MTERRDEREWELSDLEQPLHDLSPEAAGAACGGAGIGDVQLGVNVGDAYFDSVASKVQRTGSPTGTPDSMLKSGGLDPTKFERQTPDTSRQ